MSKSSIVRCRCGHQVLAKEVLRTDVYERSRGRDYVYVKYRCRRCKRMGEAFVAESRWDWNMLEPARNEMSDDERDWFLDQNPITAAEMLDFHCSLQEADAFQEFRDQLEPSPEKSQKIVESNESVRLNLLRRDADGFPPNRHRGAADESKKDSGPKKDVSPRKDTSKDSISGDPSSPS